MEVAKEMWHPVSHTRLNNGVDYVHDQNVKENEESDVQTTLHEGSSHGA